MNVATKCAAALLVSSLGLATRAHAGLRVDESTGELHFRYDFSLPAARGRFQPSLALIFGSRGTVDAGIGEGWAIPIPLIKRVVTAGVERFYYVADGSTKPLLPTGRGGSGRYAVDVEDQYMSFWRPVLSIWKAVDGSGTEYEFDNFTGDDFNLAVVTDLDGNKTFFNAGRLVTLIQYNHYDSNSPGSTAQSPAPLNSTLYASTVSLEYDSTDTTKPPLLKNIRIQNQGSAGLTTVRRYAFTYDTYVSSTTAGVSGRILTSITEIGKDSGIAYNPTTFQYSADGLLRGLTIPTGAHYDVTLWPSGQFGDTSNYWLTRTVTESGPGLDAHTTTYWYQGPTWRSNWFDQTQESRGFARCWWQDTADGIVHSVWWEVGSHAFTGVAAQRESGLQTVAGVQNTPPSYDSVFLREVSEHSARSIAAGTCTGLTVAAGTPNLAAEPASSSYPVTTFTSRGRSSRFVDSLELANEATVACPDVDPYGHVLAQRIDPDVLRAGDESVRRSSYVLATNPTTPCVDCLDRATITDTSASQNLLASTRYTYDTAWHVNGIYRTDAPNHEVTVATFTYNGNGTLASKTEGTITYSYQYGAFGPGTGQYQLRLTRLSASEGTKLLVTDYGYDDFGYQTLVTGPYLQNTGATAAQMATAYDDLGRPRLTARSPVTGGTVTGALAAFTYANSGTGPGSVTEYRFFVPSTYPDGAIPRLGGTGLGDPSAHITQNLSGYRVSGAIVYDAAGRVRAEIEPFYGASAGYVDYRTAPLDNLNSGNPGGLSSALHVTSYAYDSLGREVCRAYQVVASNAPIPPPSSSCQSSFAENSSYTRAVRTQYRGVIDSGVNLIGIKTIPAENNLATTPEGFPPTGPETFYDASSRVQKTADVNQNSTSFIYDVLGRVTATARDAPGSARPAVTSSISYDMMGRVTRRTDPNVGTVDYSSYDAQGRLLSQQLAVHAVGNGLSGRDEIHFFYDLGRPAGRENCAAGLTASGTAVQLNCSQDNWFYDSPYQSDPSYQYVGGRVAYVTNGLTTIAFGYTPEGSMAKRTQTITGLQTTAGLPAPFTLTSSGLVNGQPLQTDFGSPYGSLSYQFSYDSMRRPVRASSGSTAFWDTSSSVTTGAYDSVGRIGSFTADNGLVQASSQYAAFSGLESSASVTAGTTTLYSITNEVFLGGKLASCTDQLGQTNYRYWYTDAGRLKGATATPFGASSLSQKARLCMSYNTSKSYSSGPSFGNLERVRDQAPASPVVDTYSYSGTDIAGAAPGPDAPAQVNGPSSSSSTGNVIGHDFAGRVSSKSSTAESFGYDPLGRVTQVTRNSTVAEVLRYDPLGGLLGRLTGNTVMYYLSGHATVTATASGSCTAPGCPIDPASVQVDVHVSVGTRRVASVQVLPQSAGRVLYYHRDRLGSVVATSLGGGSSGARYRWGVHGDLSVALSETADSASELGFTGSLRLSGGLLVMGRRIYDPKLRQFLQPDIIGPMTYTYAGGDPINFVDPSGTSPVIPEGRDALRAPTRDRTDRVCVIYSDGTSGGCVCTDLACGRPRDDSGFGPGERDDRWQNPRGWEQNGGGGGQLGGRSRARPPPMTTRSWSRISGRVRNGYANLRSMLPFLPDAIGLSLTTTVIFELLSGGGGQFGLNLECTVDTGCGLYGIVPEPGTSSGGFSVSVLALEANAAWGNGSWRGPFNNVLANAGIFGGSGFYTAGVDPTMTSQTYFGVSFGGSLGLPFGAATTTTVAIPLLGGQ